MSPEQEAEAYARIVYHLPWVADEPLPSGWLRTRDGEQLRMWLAMRPVRLYLLLSRFCPQQLLPMLEVVWADAMKHLFDDPILNAMDEQDAPRMFGREAFAQKAHAARSRTVASLHDMVIHLWRTGGRHIVSGGQDFSPLVRSESLELDNFEAGIGTLLEHALRTPHMRDEQLVEAARVGFLRRAATVPAMAKFKPADLKTWSKNYLTLDRVPEARRRAAASGVGQTLDQAENDWRAKHMSEPEIADQRAQMAETLIEVDRKKTR